MLGFSETARKEHDEILALISKLQEEKLNDYIEAHKNPPCHKCKEYHEFAYCDSKLVKAAREEEYHELYYKEFKEYPKNSKLILAQLQKAYNDEINPFEKERLKKELYHAKRNDFNSPHKARKRFKPHLTQKNRKQANGRKAKYELELQWQKRLNKVDRMVLKRLIDEHNERFKRQPKALIIC